MRLDIFDRIKKAASAFRGNDELQTAKVTELASEYLKSLTNGLSPRKLNRILEAADNGDIVEQHKLFADLEDRDEHIFTELSKRRRALLPLDWAILPGREKDAKAEKIAEAVREQFDMIPSFEDLLLDLGDAIGHGFAALETQWEYRDGLHIPVAFHHRPQSWFQLGKDRATLRLRDNTQEGQELQELGWVIHTHKSRSGYFARYGLFRVLVWTYLLKMYARSDFAEYLEIHGMPLRLGTYPVSASEKEKRTLLAALQAIGHDAAGIIPDGMALEFKEAARSSEQPFMSMWDACERGQSKAILGGTLTTQADGKTSTNALGQIHNEVRRDILASDALQIANAITEQILLPLAVINCGLDDISLAPWFRFDTSEPEDLSYLADALPKLASVMKIPASWAHEKCRIPMAEGDEEILAPPLQPEQHIDKDTGPGKLARLRAELAASSGSPGTSSTPAPHDQQAIDRAEIPDETLQAAAEQMTAVLVAELKDGVPPEVLLTRLASVYPNMDSSSLEELLARAMFVGEVWGRLSAAENEAKE